MARTSRQSRGDTWRVAPVLGRPSGLTGGIGVWLEAGDEVAANREGGRPGWRRKWGLNVRGRVWSGREGGEDAAPARRTGRPPAPAKRCSVPGFIHYFSPPP
jgi:hypothetical protein